MQQVSRSEAFSYCGDERSAADECAAFVRARIAEAAAAIENAQAKGIASSAKSEELDNALFVAERLGCVLEAWPEYWSDEYLESVAVMEESP